MHAWSVIMCVCGQIIGAKWREMPPAQKKEWLDKEEAGKKAFQAK